jgi:hypothetical protein
MAKLKLPHQKGAKKEQDQVKAIQETASVIAKRSRQSPANFMIVSPQVADAINRLREE